MDFVASENIVNDTDGDHLKDVKIATKASTNIGWQQDANLGPASTWTNAVCSFVSFVWCYVITVWCVCVCVYFLGDGGGVKGEQKVICKFHRNAVLMAICS
ncbi:hypothetical protein DPMN_125283 [Dreissena polymorpha]|uniref:Uncharacterized protein n=1 Tax=Dreissena polymorpha TaxID=45954 RepID=A0A9D4GU51_DREPO|nr:hypothetical protein DPMN_125283 [Dreissena polymorpha]